MENYTNPENTGQKQNTQDLLNASLIFARALGNIFSEGEGIVVDVVGDIKLTDEIKKVIVFRHNDQVHIYKCDQDLEEGTAVNMNDDEETDPSNIEVNDAEIISNDTPIEEN
jgi:hypothetical protein